MTARREPALIIGVISGALSLLVALNFHGLTADQATLIVAAITAVSGAITAAVTRPIAPAAFTLVVTAGADLLAGFHFDLSAGTVAAINGTLLAVLVLLSRGQVSPVVAVAPAQPPAP